MGCLKSVIKLFLGIFGILIVLSIYCAVTDYNSIVNDPSKKYTHEVRFLLKNLSDLKKTNYLIKEKRVSSNGIYIIFSSKTWSNPNDTKSVVDSIAQLLKKSEVKDTFTIKFWADKYLLYSLIKSDSSVLTKDYYDKKKKLFQSNLTAASKKNDEGSILGNPKYEVVVKNKNGHTIFIVTNETSKNRLQKIVEEYTRKNRVPQDGRWMIQFFNGKEKALRVKAEWSVPYSDTPEYHNRWVYREDVDHGGIAQWTSWRGIEIDKW